MLQKTLQGRLREVEIVLHERALSAAALAVHDAADEIDRLRAALAKGAYMNDQLIKDARRWDDGRIGTHWDGCENTHYRCMILKLATALEKATASGCRHCGYAELTCANCGHLQSFDYGD